MERDYAFAIICIPLRWYLTTLGDLYTLRAFAAVVAYRWLSGLNDHSRGFFGGRAWWAPLRPVHGLLYAAYAFSGDSDFLRMDVFVGLYGRIFKDTISGWTPTYS